VHLCFRLYCTYQEEPTLGILGQLFSDYACAQGLILGYPSASLCHTMHTHAICAYPQEPTLGYPMQLCFRLHITHKDLLSGIRVQFFFFFFLMLYKHTKPTLRNPGAALFQTKQCIVYIQTRNYSWVSWYSSISSYKYTRHRDLL